MAVAGAMLERNAPLPASLARRDASQRHQRFGPCTWYRDRAITLQPLGPGFEPGLELLFDEQPAKTRAIDEQVAFDAGAAGEQHRRNVAVLLIAFDRDDLAFVPQDAALFGESAQEPGVEACVELVRIGERREHAAG